MLTSAISVGCLVFAFVFGATMLAMKLRQTLPENHLSGAAETAIRATTSLVSTMAALVLGLLLASAESHYATDDSEMIEVAAKAVFLDRMLAIFGPETKVARDNLRNQVELMRTQVWQGPQSEMERLAPNQSEGSSLYDAIERLAPGTDVQRSVKTAALEKAADLGQMRWLLFEQSDASISTPVLVVVVCWLGVIFFGFGLFAPSNRTVISMFVVAALSVSGAVFLILELNTPYSGMIQISPKPMDAALAILGH